MELPLLLATTASVIAAAMLIVWGLSLVLGDASIVDVFWGLGFALVGAAGCILGNGYAGRRMLVTGLVCAWGLRLALHLLWRNRGQGEDYRYRAMRARHGDRFAWVSLYLVFGLQGALLWIVSLPIQVAEAAPLPARLTPFDLAGSLLWLIGFGFESVGDWQLARFKADPSNRGRVMDRGLWRYTRHPNYFGDALVWWGFYLIALATPHGWWSALGPALMTFLLLRVSGVALLERKLAKTRPEYREYMARTNAFLPGPPRRSAAR